MTASTKARTTGLCYEPHESSLLASNPLSLRVILILFSHLNPYLLSGLFIPVLVTTIMYNFELLSHIFYIPIQLNLLDFIVFLISGENKRSESSSLCSFFQLPATSSLLSPYNSPQSHIFKHYVFFP
jgi:hypothetical protein